jgi:hypothetical protein
MSTSTADPKDLVLSDEERERVVYWLPRGCVLIEDLNPTSSDDDSWSVTLHYFDVKGDQFRSTHFHDSYEPEWREGPEIQLRKLGIPRGDWDYARPALWLAMALRLRRASQTVEAVVPAADKHVSTYAPSVPIHLRALDPLDDAKGRCRDAASDLEELSTREPKASEVESAFQEAILAVSTLHGESHRLVGRLEKLADFDPADVESIRTRVEQGAALVRTAEKSPRTANSVQQPSHVHVGDNVITNIHGSTVGALAAGKGSRASGSVTESPGPALSPREQSGTGASEPELGTTSKGAGASDQAQVSTGELREPPTPSPMPGQPPKAREKGRHTKVSPLVLIVGGVVVAIVVGGTGYFVLKMGGPNGVTLPQRPPQPDAPCADPNGQQRIPYRTSTICASNAFVEFVACLEASKLEEVVDDAKKTVQDTASAGSGQMQAAATAEATAVGRVQIKYSKGPLGEAVGACTRKYEGVPPPVAATSSDAAPRATAAQPGSAIDPTGKCKPGSRRTQSRQTNEFVLGGKCEALDPGPAPLLRFAETLRKNPSYCVPFSPEEGLDCCCTLR